MSAYLPLKILDQIYKIFIRSHLDYCDVIYHIPSLINDFDRAVSLNSSMELIEKIQYQAALAITGTWQGTSRNKIYDELGWECLSDRRWSRRLFHFYKIRNNMTPSYLSENMPRPRRILYGNGDNQTYYNIHCRTSRYMNSFFPDATKTWNSIGDDLRKCANLDTFKRSIQTLIRPPCKEIFGIHDNIGVKYLFQLRVGLSPLKSHKNHHNFLDTPSDCCNCFTASEDTYHFLLECHLFDICREALFSSVSTILNVDRRTATFNDTDLFLYGDSTLTFSDNKKILESTIRFVKETKRFS